ncbi:MAG: RnfABCDGE type electron transport complex subunit D [Oscillibacter sp.]|jgi:electron transport complex protein RnfD|nr:RnfABCDGE type electron transport complex subunit D [Oscillibacter sp.]
MTDYQNLKLTASSSPHIRSAEDTRSIMLDVIIAMLPALAFACYWFGFRSLTVTAVSVAGCVFWEWLYRKLLKKPQSVGDLSAVVTGILLAFVCPVQIGYWQILIGGFFAIVVVKQLFGGIGKNFLNPALAARALMLASWASSMNRWIAPHSWAAIFSSNADIVTAATPLSYLKGDEIPATFQKLTETYRVTDMFLGKIGGSMGEVSALMLILGGGYLLARKVISWQIPVSFIGTVAVLTFLFPRGNSPAEWMAYNLFGGGLLLGAFFMATDYSSSPITARGQLIYGVGCGALTVFIRYFGSYNEGVCYSIMIMNCFAALIDRSVRPSRFGAVKSAKKEAASK